VENPWPAGVPWSLWTYNQLRAEELAQLPMMGVKFTSAFLYAFAFGCVFVAIFAWQRFRRKSEVNSASRALTNLSPSDLGGNGALVRAYFIYAGSILLLYVSLTFFGKLILQSTQMIPVAGIKVDLDELQFDSPQWPLMLAFAFAGLSQMLPPVELTESWLRNRAYRAVGIPVRLEQTMRNLIVTLERACAAGKGKGELGTKLGQYHTQWNASMRHHDWLVELADQRQSRIDELLSLLSQLELLVFWAKTARGSWPGHEVSQEVRQIERDFVKEADLLLNEFQQRMSESPPQGKETDTTVRKTRFNEYIGSALDRAQALRFDLVSILAIFLERDINSPDTDAATANRTVTDLALQELLVETERPDTSGTGPESGLFFAILTVFVIYAAAAWRGLQEPIGQFVDESNLYGMLITALVETLRIASLTWLPLLAAFSLRQFLWDTGDWARARKSHRPNNYLSQILSCLCLGISVSLIGLVCVAALRAFFVAPNATYFYSLLFKGAVPFLLYYPTQAVVLIVLIPVALMSADLRASTSIRLWYGVFCAVGVGFLSVQHSYFWNGSLSFHCPGLRVIATLDCARRLDLVGHVILVILAFLAAGVFGELPERTRMQPARVLPRSLPVIALLALLPAMDARAQVAPPPEEVVVGFRADAPPFSYRDRNRANPAETRPFKGFLADLCFDIFAGDDRYRIKAVPVTAEDRFARLRDPDSPPPPGTGVAETEPIDMLCDAVTMRFSDRERAGRGIYSPIVFASGVSFLELVSRSSGEVVIGYVQNTTARDVARKVCEIDYFKALLPPQRSLLFERCNLLWHAAVAIERWNRFSNQVYGIGMAEDRALLRQELQDLSDVAERLQKLAASPEMNLSPATLDLARRVTDDPAFADCATAGTNACPQAISLISDPVCALDYQPPPPGPRRQAFEQAPWPDYHFCPRQSHEDLIRWLCTAHGTQRRVYMGDRELILGRLESWVRVNGSCNIERPQGAEYLSYEPYAFLISLSNPRLVQFVQRRIHEMFSNRTEMTSRFASSFPGREMSPALAYLFLLNAVENEENYGLQPRLKGDEPVPAAPDTTGTTN